VETCRQIREIPELKGTFVIFLTARAEEYSEVAAFDVGADDYITKPIKPRALMSRIAALFRRESKKENEVAQIKIKDLIIDRTSYTIDKNGKTITLPKKEFELLYFLAKNPNIVFSRDDLLQNIWGTDVFVLARTVDVHIRKVREKIGEDYITTVKGVGYKFELN
jgi:two-component system alkaline phosphatase synthesis response regulator PhoP